jgi:signal transduction histidine kinase
MLKTVLRNLISNAIKFTNSNGEINVSAIQNDKFIEIAVSDNGISMNEEAQNKLFKRLKQMKQELEPKTEKVMV